MNGIRFVHTDHLRLAESIAGLAAAPDWLRRLARDATRGAVSRIFDIAITQNVDFVLIGAICGQADAFHSSVIRWLEAPVEKLREHGIQVVIAATRHPESKLPADYIIQSDECLYATRNANRVQLTVGRADLPLESELAIGTASSGVSSRAKCSYLIRSGIRYSIGASHDHSPVYSAGAPQSHGPHEQGEFGCLVAEANPDTAQIDVVFEPTDPLRFETRRIQKSSIITSQDIADAIIEESRAMARRQRRTTIVDWFFDSPFECTGAIDSWREENILKSVRSTLQKGHLGVWPRRIKITASDVRLADPFDSQAAHELASLLFDNTGDTNQRTTAAFAELVTGTRLLRQAA
ncbi:MAG: hypothetical protein MK110_15025 [Fuerstiella sp.]|nr:hypothetical protein [Fuerstiella sp.]